MSDEPLTWHRVAGVGDIEEEDLIGVEVNGKAYAIYWIESGYYATDGLCSHECAPLADGFVDGDTIECPKHNARFHIPTGRVIRRPAKADLAVYPVKVEGDDILLGLAP